MEAKKVTLVYSILSAKYTKTTEKNLNINGTTRGLESIHLNQENAKAAPVVEMSHPTSTSIKNKNCPYCICAPKTIAFGIQTVIQNIQKTPFASIIADIFHRPKYTFFSKPRLLIFQISVAIQKRIPAPANDST